MRRFVLFPDGIGRRIRLSPFVIVRTLHLTKSKKKRKIKKNQKIKKTKNKKQTKIIVGLTCLPDTQSRCISIHFVALVVSV
jgi:hypothetical protein